MTDVINISGYKFIKLHDTYMQRSCFQESVGAIGLKGSIIFAPEGINFMLAGTMPQINKFYQLCQADSRFADIKFKESVSDVVPFDFLAIKRKQHIVPSVKDVSMNDVKNGAKISAFELKKWLDENRDFTLIDTRNTYEIDEGSFEKAIDFKLDNFRQIYQAFESCAEEVKKKPVVMYCTGGIRCEKGVPLALAAGFEEVYQLDGGILKYFENCGSEHYTGDCFVFDQRVAVNSNLRNESDL